MLFKNILNNIKCKALFIRYLKDLVSKIEFSKKMQSIL